MTTTQRNPLAVRETPAGRVIGLGASALSSVELIALISGMQSDRATNLLAGSDYSLRKLASVLNGKDSPKLKAAFELGRRTAAEERPEGQPFRWPRDVFDYYARLAIQHRHPTTE